MDDPIIYSLFESLGAVSILVFINLILICLAYGYNVKKNHKFMGSFLISSSLLLLFSHILNESNNDIGFSSLLGIIIVGGYYFALITHNINRKYCCSNSDTNNDDNMIELEPRTIELQPGSNVSSREKIQNRTFLKSIDLEILFTNFINGIVVSEKFLLCNIDGWVTLIMLFLVMIPYILEKFDKNMKNSTNLFLHICYSFFSYLGWLLPNIIIQYDIEIIHYFALFSFGSLLYINISLLSRMIYDENINYQRIKILLSGMGIGCSSLIFLSNYSC